MTSRTGQCHISGTKGHILKVFRNGGEKFKIQLCQISYLCSKLYGAQKRKTPGAITVLRHLSEWHFSERHLSEPFSATAHLSDKLLERFTIWANVILAIIKYSEYQFQHSQFERAFHGYRGPYCGRWNWFRWNTAFAHIENRCIRQSLKSRHR